MEDENVLHSENNLWEEIFICLSKVKSLIDNYSEKKYNNNKFPLSKLFHKIIQPNFDQEDILVEFEKIIKKLKIKKDKDILSSSNKLLNFLLYGLHIESIFINSEKKNFNNINLEDLDYYFNKPEHKKFKKNNKKILKEIKEISENKKQKNTEILKEILNVQENLKKCSSTELMELFNKVLTDYKKECEENYKDYYLEYKNSDAFISPEESLKCLLCETFSNSILGFTPVDLKYSEEFNHGNQRREKFLSIMKSSPNYSELVELSKKRLFSKMQQWVASGGRDLKNKMNYLKKSGKLLKDGGDEFFKLIFED